MESDELNFDFDAESGMPILPCQRPMGVMRTTNDLDGSVVREVLVLPNLILYMMPLGDTDIMVGDSALTHPASARQIVDTMLPESCERQAACDCDWHTENTTELVNPQEAW